MMKKMKARNVTMQVYELISELSKLPAGAEVEFSTVLTADEVANLEKINDDEVLYRIAVKVNEVDIVHRMLVALHR